ncbi:MAG: hypothetical protein U0625_07435 [Phycisphaerales bacterium]
MLTLLGLVLLVVLAAALGVGVIWWALFADKARGRRRCPRCWHDLSGTPGLICGECGYLAIEEREFARTRRRWAIAAVGLLAILVGASWLQLRVTGQRWSASLPTGALVALMPLSHPPSGASEAWDELERRTWQEELSAPQLLDVAGAALQMLPGAEGPDMTALALMRAAADATPAELQDSPDLPRGERDARARALEEHRGAMERLLASAPLIAKVQVPAAWPRGVRPFVRVGGVLPGVRAEWRARIEGGDPVWTVWSGESTRSPRSLNAQLRLPEGSEESTQVAGRLLLETRRFDRAANAWEPWKEHPPLDFTGAIARLPDPQLATDESEALQSTFAEAFGNPITVWDDADRPVAVRYGPTRFIASEHADLLVGVVLELCEGDQVRRRTRFWWHGGNPDPRHEWETTLEDIPALQRLAAAAREAAKAQRTGPRGGAVVPGWTLVIRGDRETALRAIPFAGTAIAPARWWKGEVRLPVEAQLAGTPAPTRPIRREPLAPGP